MSLEALSELEEKIQNTSEIMSLYRMEVDDLKESKKQLENELEELRQRNEQLLNETKELQEERQSWSDKLNSLLGKIDIMTQEVA